jgi:hypothetical protein
MGVNLSVNTCDQLWLIENSVEQHYQFGNIPIATNPD